ncbi:MAG: Na(+)-translocating NADH-quinone reductase subunit C [Planctomycetota bacterium]|jgi:Na+-transporting NADH:ubiquinone oxidoreductase subunit C|nr:Na(+)-translocating NADH-quinone reductase subunit C [Planctomycetota bacterium]
MRHDSVLGTLTVAAVLCIVCSVIVSATAVSLRERQESNKVLEMKRNVLVAAGLFEEGDTVEELFGQVERHLIDLSSGRVVEDGEVDPESYDPRTAAKDPELGVEIDPEKDLAGIKRRGKYAFVYLVRKDEAIEQIILPVYGKGLWSTLYGFLSLRRDGRTVSGITFYEHKETPGLGGEVDNPVWKASWSGKQVRDESGRPILEVLRGSVSAEDPQAFHKIDGLSGATITSRGVQNLIQYWLGSDGFGPYLEQLDR